MSWRAGGALRPPTSNMSIASTATTPDHECLSELLKESNALLRQLHGGSGHEGVASDEMAAAFGDCLLRECHSRRAPQNAAEDNNATAAAQHSPAQPGSDAEAEMSPEEVHEVQQSRSGACSAPTRSRLTSNAHGLAVPRLRILTPSLNGSKRTPRGRWGVSC